MLTLARHPDPRFVGFIYRGLTEGFRIGFDHRTAEHRGSGRNLPSAMVNPGVVAARISAEMEVGRLFGPVAQHIAHLVHCSPIGLVLKSHQTNKWRLIVDLSSPQDHSINDGVSSDWCSMKYASVDDAVETILRLGRFTKLIKINVKEVYLIVPVHPDDHLLLGIRWMEAVYVDRALPFGLRSAPKIFSALADSLAWLLYTQGVQYQLHYLDDFLFFALPQSANPTEILSNVLNHFSWLGVPVATHKTEGPATCISFLCILIDTDRMELRFPTDNVECLRSLLGEWCRRTSCTRKDLESFLGHLSHAASVIHPGRTFLRHLFSLLPKRPHHRIRLTLVAQADIRWWRTFTTNWIDCLLLPHPSIHVFSDTSGLFGCGAFATPMGWFQLQWPPSWDVDNITVKELLPIVVAAAIWGRAWRGQLVLFHCKNMAVVEMVKHGTGRSAAITHLLRCLFFYTAHFGFQQSITHISGAANMAADGLSRNNLSIFSSLFPKVPQCLIPKTVLDLLVSIRPDWGSHTWISTFRNSLKQVSQRPQPEPTARAAVVT